MPPRRKSKEPLTDDEKYQQQLQQEQELGRLQRQYHHLDKDRGQFAPSKLAKQNKVYSIFKNEHDNILTDLAVASAPEKRKEDAKTSDYLTTLLTQYDVFNDNVATQKTYIKEIEGQIKMVGKEVQNLRAQQITDKQYTERVWQAMKTVEGLENKLETQIRKFCAICAENKVLREEIHHLLIERQSLMKLWEKLLNKLNIGKKFMMDLIEQATIAYDQREEWCSKLQALRLKAHMDFQQHTQEMRELKRRQDNNKKLNEFFNVKGQKRVMRDLEMNEKVKRYELKAKMKEQLERYQGMMKEILEFSKEDRVSIIAKKFIQQEAINFTLFKYVNDLIEEMESVNDNLGYLHLDIDEQKAIHDSRVKQQTSRIEELESEAEALKNEEKNKQDELTRVKKEVDIMIQGINALFKICKCTNDPLLQLLGNNSVINQFNVLLYIEILEKQVHECLLMAGYRDKTMLDKRQIVPSQKILEDNKVKPQLHVITDSAGSSPCPLCVEHEMVSDVIDSLQFAISRDEAKEKLKQRLELPDGLARVHNVSACHLPKSREIIQRRYQQ